MIELIEVKSDDEINEAARLAKIIWNEYFPAIIGQDQVDYMVDKFQSRNAITSQIAEGYLYYLIRSRFEDVGYIGLIPHYNQQRMQISKFYILKDSRGQGIATEVLTRIISISKELGFTKLYLTVNKFNTSSITVYKKLGFINTRELLMDIGQGYTMDDYEMEISIPE